MWRLNDRAIFCCVGWLLAVNVFAFQPLFRWDCLWVTWNALRDSFQDKECWIWTQQCAVSLEAPLGSSPFPPRVHILSLKSLIRPKVWISYHQNPNIENLNCHIDLTVWTLKKTQILLERSQLSYLVTLPAQALCQRGFSSSLLWRAELPMCASVPISGLTARVAVPYPLLCSGSAGSVGLRAGADTTHASTDFLFCVEWFYL